MDRESYNYQPYFCEENIWHLLDRLKSQLELAQLQVLFFINESNEVLLMNQSAFGDAGIGCWDYHVVLLNRQRLTIVDFDTTLSFESGVDEYLKFTFPDQKLVDERHQTTVRIVAAEDYLNFFSSDRSHMLNSDGQEIAKMPQWPPIIREVQRLNLVDLVDSEFVDERLTDIAMETFAQSWKEN